MGFGAVSRVPALPQHVSCVHPRTRFYRHAAAAQVAQHHARAGSSPDRDVIAGQRRPPACHSPSLRDGVPDRRQTTECVVILLGVMCCHHRPVDGGEYRPSEPREPVRRLRPNQTRDSQWRRPAGHVDRDEVDRIRTGEGARSVAGYPVGRRVLHRPTTGERVTQVDHIQTRGHALHSSSLTDRRSHINVVAHGQMYPWAKQLRRRHTPCGARPRANRIQAG